MNPLLNTRKLLSALTLGCASAAPLSAQFITANAQEAQAYASGINQGHAAISSVSDFALTNLAAGPGFRGSYAYDQVNTERDGSDRAFKTEITQHSAHIGYVHHFDAVAAGINLSYLDSEADSDYRDTNAGKVNLDGDGWMLSGGFAHTWENLTVSLIGGAGQLSLDGTRRSTSNLILGESSSSFDTDLYFVTADVHYGFVISPHWVTAPFVQLKYLNVSMDGFQEKGGADSGKVDSTKRDWITAELGLRTQLQVSDRLIASLVLSWEHDFNSSKTEVSGTSQGGLAGGLDVPDVGENSFKAALGLDYVLDANWTLSAGASIASGDKYDAYGARAVLSYGF